MNVLRIIHIKNNMLDFQDGITKEEIYNMNYKSNVKHFKRAVASFIRVNVHVRFLMEKLISTWNVSENFQERPQLDNDTFIQDNGKEVFGSNNFYQMRNLRNNTRLLIRTKCCKKWNIVMLRNQKI